jgi:hypothetical protein
MQPLPETAGMHAEENRRPQDHPVSRRMGPGRHGTPASVRHNETLYESRILPDQGVEQSESGDELDGYRLQSEAGAEYPGSETNGPGPGPGPRPDHRGGLNHLSFHLVHFGFSTQPRAGLGVIFFTFAKRHI